MFNIFKKFSASAMKRKKRGRNKERYCEKLLAEKDLVFAFANFYEMHKDAIEDAMCFHKGDLQDLMRKCSAEKRMYNKKQKTEQNRYDYNISIEQTKKLLSKVAW